MRKKDYKKCYETAQEENKTLEVVDESVKEVIETIEELPETDEEVVNVEVEEPVEIETNEEEVVNVEVEEPVEIEEVPTFGIVKDCKILNVRKEPNKNSEVISTVTLSTKIEILLKDSTEDFYCVKIDDVIAYCMKKYISLV